MSVIFAIRTKSAVAVASDSQYVSASGQSQAPYDKTFMVSDVLLVGYCGLMAFAGQHTRTHLQDAIRDVKPRTADVIDKLTAHLGRLLESVDEMEVGFAHRRLDVLVASRTEIMSIGCFPVVENRSVRVERNENSLYLVAGDPGAMSAVHRRVSRARNIQAFGRKFLVPFVDSVLTAAIGAAGENPNHPGVPNCCGPANILVLPK